MSVKWTDNQKKAIECETGRVLVSAAAGSGKTAVLVARIIEKITKECVDIDKILALTFTNAAAAEMRERILASLSQRLEDDPKNVHLERQIALLGRAKISTIHAFCQTLLRNNFHKLGLSPNFTIADEVDLALLRCQALDEVLEERYATGEEDFLFLAQIYGGKRDDADLCKLILDLHEFAKSTADPQKWLESSAKKLFIQPGVAPNDYLTQTFGGIYITLLENQIKSTVNVYSQIIRDAESDPGLEGYCALLETERAAVASLLNHSDWDSLYNALRAISFGRMPSRGKEADPDLSDRIKAARKKEKERIEELRSDVFYADSAGICEDLARLYDTIHTLCDVVLDFDIIFAHLKSEHNLLDFSDLEHFTIRLLRENPDENFVSFHEIFIDEFQDTSQAQAEIFRRISTNNTFRVGDMKQSIYRFRNADPRLFIAEKHDCDQLINLSQNFRSRPEILDVINHIFSVIMSETVGEIAYNNEEKLLHSGIYEKNNDPKTELYIIEKKIEDGADLSDEELQIDGTVQEAQFITSRIIDLVEQEKPLIFDKSEGMHRPVQYRDIAVLVRTSKNVTSIFANEMTQKGVPVFCEDGGSFFASREIVAILSLLQIIDNPLQDIPLLAVLRSPFFCFTDDDLAEIRATQKDSTFYDAIKIHAENGSEKCKDFLNKLKHYKDLSRNMTIPELLQQILTETDYETYVASLPNSAIRLANLRLLREHADAFSAHSYKSVFDFTQYIKAMLDSDYDFAVARFASENENAVRLMTIHKSKGLEFPVLFLARCGGQFNMRDLHPPFLFDFDLGVGADLIDRRGLRYPTIIKQAIKAKKCLELLSEEMRVLYVALTRAIDRLIITGTTPNLDKSLARWESASSAPKALLPHIISNQNCFLDWLGIALKSAPSELPISTTHLKAHEVIQNYSEITLAQQSTQTIHVNDIENQSLAQEIDARLSYVYPFAVDTQVPTKVSVSELISEDTTLNLKNPRFIQKSQKFSSTLRGTIIHFIMQNIDIHDTNSESAIAQQIDNFVESGMISHDFANQVTPKAIYDFFRLELGTRMKKSRNVMREVKFFVEFPASDLFPESTSSEKVLMQGVVDCCFQESDGFVIIDYKTGAPRPEYEKQVALYKKALEQILKMPVKESHVCLL